MTDPATRAIIREVLAIHAALPLSVDTLDDDADLFRAGMLSFATVNVMLGIEEAFGFEFPDEMLKREVFTSVNTIGAAVEALRARPAA